VDLELTTHMPIAQLALRSMKARGRHELVFRSQFNVFLVFPLLYKVFMLLWSSLLPLSIT
jgi:hypothetical protein